MSEPSTRVKDKSDYIVMGSLKNEERKLDAFSSVKRFVDLLGSLIGIIITLPIIIVVYVIYKFEDYKAPVFFKQERYGKKGEVFNIYKFRSMVIDADQKLKENKALYEKYLKNNYKLEAHEDPRITRLGRFLRATSLDELPQLFNVLNGSMSLVGPRPIVKEELLEYKEKASDFLTVKPGITGYWQVSGRSNVGYPERIDIELYYVYNQSILLDIKILFKTVFVVIIKRGAY